MGDNEREKDAGNLWYTRRRGEVQGPFPAGLISRYILLGRIQGEDELSPDGRDWRPFREYSELVPEVMRNVRTDEDREKLLLARMHEDERGHGDRRDAGEPPAGYQGNDRRGSDRRRPEPEVMVRRREIKTRNSDMSRERPENYRWAGVVVLLVVAGLTGLFALFTPAPVENVSQCGLEPRPGINWSNCPLEGVRAPRADLRGANLTNADLRGARLHGAKLAQTDLAYANLSQGDLSYADLAQARMKGTGLRQADLSYANLAGADLSYADLTNAKLGGSNLEGAKLDNAIWVDRRVCAPGSRGTCLSATAAPSPR